MMDGEALSCIARPGTLLICTVGRNKGERLVAAAKKAGARGGTQLLGRSLKNNRFLQACQLADVHLDIVIILLGAERRAVIRAVRDAALAGKIEGDALTLDVSDVLMRPCQTAAAEPVADAGTKSDPADAAAPQQNITPPPTENTRMESGHKLITVIVNNGFAEDVMAVARKAGATGGTILTARGTGTEEDVKFFGISLVPEKDMLLIVADTATAPAILTAVAGMPALYEAGSGIAFSMDVEEFIPLGQ